MLRTGGGSIKFCIPHLLTAPLNAPDYGLMPLTMRPTGLGSGIDKDRPDYTILTGEWEIRRIYQTRGGPDSLRWFANGPDTIGGEWRVWQRPRGSFRKAGTPGRLGRTEEMGWTAYRYTLVAFQPSWCLAPLPPRGFSLRTGNHDKFLG